MSLSDTHASNKTSRQNVKSVSKVIGITSKRSAKLNFKEGDSIRPKVIDTISNLDSVTFFRFNHALFRGSKTLPIYFFA